MVVNKVWAVYFSATGTTKKVVEAIADVIADKLGAARETYDFTRPQARENAPCFEPDDLVVFGTPVYAGRVPNVLLKYLETISGNGAAAVPVVLYGNRDYDDALIELRDIMEKDGFHTIAAAAFVGEHSFSYILAKGRPDEADLQKTGTFAANVAEKAAVIAGKAAGLTEFGSAPPIEVKGTPEPYRGYYQPRDRKGEPVDIRKVKPLTNDACNDCKICADTCPMGSISRDDVKEYTGICIKCGACIKNCPLQAKYYEDAGYLYHQHELEEGLTRRAEPEWFL
jgi:ferredoxin/flavodoxin